MIDEDPHNAYVGPNWRALLRVAQELQRGVDGLPVWAEHTGEAWPAFKRRHGQGEQELAERLRRMPGCTVLRSTNGSSTTLRLAGLEAKAQGGIAAACRSWTAKVQRAALASSPPLP